MRKKLGDIVEIDLPNGKKAFGRLYKESVIGIFNGLYNDVEELEYDVGYYRFIGIYKQDLGRLKTVAYLQFADAEDAWPPDMVVVDAITGQGSRYHHGQIIPCTYEECENLEVVAAWHTYHIVDMLMGDDKWDRSIRKPWHN